MEPQGSFSSEFSTMLQQALAFLCGCLGGAIWAKKGHEGRDEEQGASFCFEGRVLTLEKVLKTSAVFPCVGSKTKDANRLLKPEFRWPVSDRWPDLEFRFLMISTVLFPRFCTSLGQLQLCIEEMSFAWWEENEGGRSWSGLIGDAEESWPLMPGPGSGQERTGEEGCHQGQLTTFTNLLRLNFSSISGHSKYCCLELYNLITYKMLLQFYI